MALIDPLTSRPISRRRFGLAAGGAIATAAWGWTRLVTTTSAQDAEGRLTARPRPGVATSLTSGPLGLGDGGRDGVVQMPSAASNGPLPLLVFLHGATQGAASVVRRIGPAVDKAGIALLVPESRGMTWDGIRGRFGGDVAFLNRALDHVLSRLAVDPARIAIGGFSDGASYGLSLGLANGDLFPKILACSPGFVIPAPAHGQPRVFVSHGAYDQILPIDRCSYVIVPRLESTGYDVTFLEFEGRHELPAVVVAEALKWMLG
jgi:phospholipase/carboxylesterase